LTFVNGGRELGSDVLNLARAYWVGRRRRLDTAGQNSARLTLVRASRGCIHGGLGKSLALVGVADLEHRLAVWFGFDDRAALAVRSMSDEKPPAANAEEAISAARAAIDTAFIIDVLLR
jgi:hypothetical protein